MARVRVRLNVERRLKAELQMGDHEVLNQCLDCKTRQGRKHKRVMFHEESTGYAGHARKAAPCNERPVMNADGLSRLNRKYLFPPCRRGLRSEPPSGSAG